MILFHLKRTETIMFRSGQTTTFRQPLSSAPKALLVPLRSGRGSARLNQRKMAPRVSAHSERVHGRRLVRRGLTAAVCCITLGALDGEATVSLSAGAHRAGRTPPGAVATCAPLAAGPAGVLSPASVEELAGILPAGRLQLTRLTGRPVCRTAPVSASALALCQQPVPSR